jgi:hypothetical protein
LAQVSPCAAVERAIDGQQEPGDDELLGNYHLSFTEGVTMRRTSYLSAFSLFGLLTAGLIACGGSDLTPQETCNQVMSAVCQRLSDCGQLGTTSIADCTKSMQASNCTNAADITCPTGTTFQAGQAQKCIDEQKGQSCTDVENGVMPAACELVCAAGGGGTGGTGGGGTGGTGGSGGGLAIQDACKEVMALLCSKTSTCSGSAGLSALGYTSVSACTTDMQAQSCATPEDAACDTGMTYYPSQAQSCITGLSSLACTDFTNGSFPASCDLICQ